MCGTTGWGRSEPSLLTWTRFSNRNVLEGLSDGRDVIFRGVSEDSGVLCSGLDLTGVVRTRRAESSTG